METLPLPPNVYSATCATRQVLDRIADKWTALVIGTLEDGPMRFSQIQKRIDGISQKMLTQTLRSLERDGLIKREAFAEVPPRVVYTLTPLGETLCAPIAAIRVWAETHISEVSEAQNAYDSAET